MKKAELEEILQQIADLVSKVPTDPGDYDDEDDVPRTKKTKPSLGKQVLEDPSAFKPRSEENLFRKAEPLRHTFGPNMVCETDVRGFATPNNRSPLEIVLDASEGFIPLWSKGVTLRWRFNESSMSFFQNVEAAKSGIRALLSDAVLAWGDSAPVGFNELEDAWDFEIVMRNSDNCNINGCTLASAFFPDGGRHQLFIYPKMFTQSRKEQVDTMIHEIGHVFGLRHFFAAVSESAWPSEIFGTHKPFSIMNYGDQSELTSDDKADLKELYQQVWSGNLSKINGTPIRLVEPFHASGAVV